MHLSSRGSGYPVLFIHGMPTSGRLWSSVIDRLSDRFTCHAVDLPGLGKTPKIPYTPKHLEMLAEQIEQIRVQQNIEKWHVVGHDAGTAIAVHYAHRFQDRVDHLVLLTPSIFPELKPFHLFRLMRIPVLGELLAPIVSVIFWHIAMRMAVEGAGSEDDGALAEFRAPFSGLRGSWRLMSVMRFGNPAQLMAAIPGMLPQLLVPTLIFHGNQDRAVPKLFAQRASALIPQSEFLPVDTGHFIPLSKPGLVAAEMRRFFGGHAAN